MVKPGDACDCGCGSLFYKLPASDGTKLEVYCYSLKGVVQKDTEFPDKLTKEETEKFKDENKPKSKIK